MSAEYVQIELREGVLRLTLNDPPTRNAINPEMAGEFLAALERFEDDPGQRVLLLTGAPPAFLFRGQCAGFSQRH